MTVHTGAEAGMYAGIDLGTSSVKVVLCAADGRVLAAGHASYPMLGGAVGIAEQDPAAWWSALCAAFGAALAACGQPADALRAIGMSGQMHGIVALDGAGMVLRPAILWADQRGAAECAWVEAQFAAAELLGITGSRASVAMSAVKMRWLQCYEPELYEQARWLLQPKDYVRFVLTGDIASDPSDAAGTLLWDLAQQRWSDKLCGRLGIDMQRLPPVMASGAVAGQLRPQAAAALGVRAGIPVVCGAGDTAAQAYAYGAVEPGLVLATISSGGQLITTLDAVRTDPRGRVHTFAHALPARWYALGAIQAAGLAFDWLHSVLGASYAELLTDAAQVPAGADGVVFLPYLLGERTPHLDNEARALFFGLALRHGRTELARAVLEGVAFAFRDALGVFTELELPVERFWLGGGGAQSPLWRTIFADVLGIPVQPVAVAHGAAQGAALLAAHGLGMRIHASVDPTAQSTPILPNPAHRAVYDERYATYRGLYQAVCGMR